jgi:hypothetical protein
MKTLEIRIDAALGKVNMLSVLLSQHSARMVSSRVEGHSAVESK